MNYFFLYLFLKIYIKNLLICSQNEKETQHLIKQYYLSSVFRNEVRCYERGGIERYTLSMNVKIWELFSNKYK